MAGHENTVHITDISLDFDDEIAVAMSATDAVVHPNRYTLKAVVANYVEPVRRARLAWGLCTEMGCPDVNIGAGFESTARPSYDYEYVSHYPQPIGPIQDGQEVLGRSFEDSADESVTLLLHSSMTDAAVFLQANETLARRKLDRVFIQGGVESKHGSPVLCQGKLQPDDSFNYTCDMDAAKELVARVQSVADTTFVSRHMAYGCGAPFANFELDRDPEWPIATTALERFTGSADTYWRAANLPTTDPNRGLPARCDRRHVITTMLDGVDTDRSGDQSVADLVTTVSPFDAIMKLLSQDNGVDRYCRPVFHEYGGHTHRIIGIDSAENGIKPSALRLLNARITFLMMDYLADEPAWRRVARYRQGSKGNEDRMYGALSVERV